jgi:hypothetical protein
MDKKKLLSFQTDEETIESLKNMVADSNWDITVKSELDQFLLELDPVKYHLLIIEEESLNDDVREILYNYELPVIFISDFPEKLKNKVVLPEKFSPIDLKKAMTKASFMKISQKENESKNNDSDCCLEPVEGKEDEAAVLLEPILGEAQDDEAVILTADNEEKEVRSSWEIPDKEVLDICDSEDQKVQCECPPDDNLEKIPEEKNEEKGSIFDKMDEIDKLISELSDDIENEKTFGTHVGENDSSTPMEKMAESDSIFESEDDGVEDIFDDDYSFPKEEENDDKTIQAESEKMESQSKIASDFETIMSKEKKDDDDYEQEWMESEKESEPIVEEVEPVEEVEEAEPVEEVEEVEEYKKEIHAWLEKNGRKIIKEVVEEQLSKIWEKK